jgi:hypothetical protein
MREQSTTVAFLFSPVARGIRVIAGIALLLWAFYGLTGVGRDIAAVVGVVLILSGVVNFCGLSPLFGGPFMRKSR